MKTLLLTLTLISPFAIAENYSNCVMAKFFELRLQTPCSLDQLYDQVHLAHVSCNDFVQELMPKPEDILDLEKVEAAGRDITRLRSTADAPMTVGLQMELQNCKIKKEITVSDGGEMIVITP